MVPGPGLGLGGTCGLRHAARHHRNLGRAGAGRPLSGPAGFLLRRSSEQAKPAQARPPKRAARDPALLTYSAAYLTRMAAGLALGPPTAASNHRKLPQQQRHSPTPTSLSTLPPQLQPQCRASSAAPPSAPPRACEPPRPPSSPAGGPAAPRLPRTGRPPRTPSRPVRSVTPNSTYVVLPSIGHVGRCSSSWELPRAVDRLCSVEPAVRCFVFR